MTPGSSTLQYQVYRNIDDVPMTDESWDALVNDAGFCGVFLQRFWVRTWWQHFGSAYDLCFVTAEESGRVIGFAPLMIDGSGALRFIGDLNADYLGFVVPRDRTDLVDGFLEFVSGSDQAWTDAHLRNIPQEAMRNREFMQMCRKRGLFPWNNYSVQAPYLQIAGNQEGIDKLFSKYSFRRSEKQLARNGEIRFEIFVDSAQAGPYWQAFAEQHIDRCNKGRRESSFSDPAYLPYLKALFDADPTHSRVHFSALFIADRPVAFHFGFVSQNRLLWYKPSFDTSISKGSPGVALIHRLVRHAQAVGIAELDFTIGEEPFKDRFCSGKREVNTFRLHRSRWQYMTDRSYWRVRQGLKRALK